MDKEQEYERLEEEVREELSGIDNMLEEAVSRCIKLSNDEVCASMTFKVPAFIYPENAKEIKDKLLRLKQLSKELDLSELNDDDINSAIEALDTLESSYEKEFEKSEDIDDLRWGLAINLAEPPI